MSSTMLRGVLVLIAFVGIVLLHPGVVHALYTQTQIENALPDGVNSAIGWDQDCYDFMNHYANTSYSLRAVINGIPPNYNGIAGASYIDSTWLSKQGSPNIKSPINVNYSSGSTPINLQINSVTFLCGTLIDAPGTGDHGWADSNPQPSSVIPNIANDSNRWAQKTTDGEDQPPNAIGSNNMHPARTGTYTKIMSLSVDGSPTGTSMPACQGSIGQGPVGSIMTITRNGSHRYWFAAAKADTFTATSITRDCRLSVVMKYRIIDDYNGTLICQHIDSSGNTVDYTPSGTGSSSFNPCKDYQRTLRLTFNVVNIPDAAPQITIATVTQPTCTSRGNIYGAAWDPDNWYPATAANQMTVVVHMDSPTGPSTTVTANVYEFTDGSGRVHSHGFNFDPTVFASSGYSTATTHTFYFDTQGVSNVNGDASNLPAVEKQAVLNAVSGDCYPPSGTITSYACSLITGNAIDNDSPNTSLTITFYLNSTSGPSATASTDASHNFSFNPQASFSSYFPSFSPHNIYAYVKGVDTSGNPAGTPVQLSGSPVSIYCPPAVSCRSVTPSIGEADSPATITAVFNYTSADAPSYPTYSINISVNPSGGSGSGISSATNNTASYTYTTPNLPAGRYTATATFSGSYGFTTVPCPPAPFIAYNLPYYKVYGNDVKAGGAFDAGSCSNNIGNNIGNIGFLGGFMPSPDGYGIKGFDNTSNTGAGAQFAAYAIGHIASFNSAMMRAAVGGNPGPTKGLTFANSGGTYGGDVGGTNCIHNYYNDISQLGSSSALGASADPASLNGNYTRTGDLTLNSSAVVPKGSRTIIYVTGGNVYIGAGNGGIKYDTSTWGSLADIPSLWIVVNGGNIFIDPGVTQLDGVYVAQPTTTNTKGKIFTCANNGFGAPDLSSINGTAGDACNKQLIVNGAFIAQEVELLRSYSSLRFSQAGEFPIPSGTNPNCAIVATCAAEVFNFSPEVFMAPPNGLGNSGGSKYDSITELPPVL